MKGIVGSIFLYMVVFVVVFLIWLLGYNDGKDAIIKRRQYGDDMIWNAAWSGRDSIAVKDIWDANQGHHLDTLYKKPFCKYKPYIQLP